MTRYPLVYRNRIVLFYRGFMLVWFGLVAAGTLSAMTGDPRPVDPWTPSILGLFWLIGLWGLFWAFKQETSEVRVTGPRNIHIRRGSAFRRADHRIDRARLWIEDTTDGDGDPYFKLWMDAPGGPLAVKEGHQRPALATAMAEIETAVGKV